MLTAREGFISSASDLQIDERSRPYMLREAHEQDIPAINEMFYQEYGLSYPYPLSSFNPSGIYIVAERRETSEMVGFARAAPHHGHVGVYELGGLIVKRDHRGRDIAKRMTIRRMRVCRSRGAKVVISEPVCYRLHCESQRNLLKFGFVLLGIQPAKYPDIQTEILQGQPESVLKTACWLSGDSGFGSRKIFLPKNYRGLPYGYLPREIHGRHFRAALGGTIPPSVHHPSRTGEHLLGAEYVDVPANWQDSEEAIAEYARRGYRFSCLLPAFGDLENGDHFDYVRMYRLPDSIHGFDFRRVHVVEYLEPLRRYMAGEHNLRR